MAIYGQTLNYDNFYPYTQHHIFFAARNRADNRLLQEATKQNPPWLDRHVPRFRWNNVFKLQLPTAKKVSIEPLNSFELEQVIVLEIFR